MGCNSSKLDITTIVPRTHVFYPLSCVLAVVLNLLWRRIKPKDGM